MTSSDTTATAKEKKIPLMELFGPTIQGEGLVIGQRTFFIRTGLCDYKCTACDSMHAVDPSSVRANAEWLTENEIIDKFTDFQEGKNCGWVTLSGGNPAIHDLSKVITTLKLGGYGVALETQGTLLPSWIFDCDYITVSPKSPGMGEKFEQEKYLNYINTLSLHPGLSVKVVIFSAIDLEFASMIAEMSNNVVNSDRFYLSLGNPYPPDLHGKTSSNIDIFESIERYKSLVEDIKEYPSLRTARFLPQLHSWLWGNEKGR